MTEAEETSGSGTSDAPERVSRSGPVERPSSTGGRRRIPINRLTLSGMSLSVLVVLGDALVLDGRLFGSQTWAFAVWGVVVAALTVGAVAYLKRKKDEP